MMSSIWRAVRCIGIRIFNQQRLTNLPGRGNRGNQARKEHCSVASAIPPVDIGAFGLVYSAALLDSDFGGNEFGIVDAGEL